MASVAIIGPGRLGLALAAAFEQGRAVEEVVVFGRHREALDHPVLRAEGVRYVHGLEPLPGDCQAVFLTVPDEAVPEVAYSLASQGEAPPGCAALHVSGILPTDVMGPLHHRGYGVGSFYPLVVLTDPARGASRFVDSWAAVTAAPETFRRAQLLADAIGVNVFAVPAFRRPLFHAAIALVQGALLPTLTHSSALLQQAGVDSGEALPALTALARSTLDALEEGGVSMAASGPVATGDVETTALHLRALDAADQRTYAVLARELLRLAEGEGAAGYASGAEVRGAVEELLDRYAAPESTGVGAGQ